MTSGQLRSIIFEPAKTTIRDYSNRKVSSKLESHAGFDLARIQSSGGSSKIRRRHHTRHGGNVGAIECIGYVCKDVEIPGAVCVSITPVRRAEEKRFRDIEIEGERFRTRTAISGYSRRTTKIAAFITAD